MCTVKQFVYLKSGIYGRTWSYSSEPDDTHLIIVPSDQMSGEDFDAKNCKAHITVVSDIAFMSDSYSEVKDFVSKNQDKAV